MLERLQSSGMGQPDRVNGNPFEGLMWGLGNHAVRRAECPSNSIGNPPSGSIASPMGPAWP